MSPLFSVVIPTYNQAGFLKKALDSVLSQTFEDFEVIVVNNHSSDNTSEILESYNDPRLKIIDFENNGIIGASRNKGIQVSTGAFIAFLDSDDIWYPEKLARVSKAIEENPKIGLICHNQDLVRNGIVEQQTNYGPPDDYHGQIYNYVLESSNGPSTSATVVARRELETVSGFSEEQALVTVEDYDLWLRLARVCQFHFIKSVLGTHLFHEESSSHNAERLLSGGLAVLDKISLELRHGHETLSRDDFKRRCRAIRFHKSNAYFVAGRNYQRQGAFKKPLQYLGKSLKIYPLHRKAIGSIALLLTDRLMGVRSRKYLTRLLWGHKWHWG